MNFKATRRKVMTRLMDKSQGKGLRGVLKAVGGEVSIPKGAGEEQPSACNHGSPGDCGVGAGW